MKCLSRIEIQEYLDKEHEPGIMKAISSHLGECEACSKLFREAAADKVLVNKFIGHDNHIDDSAAIPEFVPPVLYKKRTTFYRFIPYLVAASLIGIILLFSTDMAPKTEPLPEAEILLYEFYDGQDLNKMWHEKSQLIILQDENGNVIHSIITN
jgi:hypothetical protein